MASEGTHNWSGKSGQEYVYRIYKLPPRLKTLPGNYIFAKQTSVGGWVAVYVGETDNLRERFDQHDALPCIRQHEATHLHAHATEGDETARRSEVDDLVAIWQPPCND